jgi:hypothetical protein
MTREPGESCRATGISGRSANGTSFDRLDRRVFEGPNGRNRGVENIAQIARDKVCRAPRKRPGTASSRFVVECRFRTFTHSVPPPFFAPYGPESSASNGASAGVLSSVHGPKSRSCRRTNTFHPIRSAIARGEPHEVRFPARNLPGMRLPRERSSAPTAARSGEGSKRESPHGRTYRTYNCQFNPYQPIYILRTP